MNRAPAPVDDRLLRCRSAQLLCSRCFRRGIRRHVVQIISPRHRLQPLCSDCRITCRPSLSPA